MSMTNQHAGEASIDCVVVGAGPAGMMAGLLLARRGVRVT
ncbi:FAD-binding protein, partial [Xanthomonas citri pv. citri]|nr:FAD-binding protein [Xanthomonas citri pv. citri]